jgi:hypothetical protein
MGSGERRKERTLERQKVMGKHVPWPKLAGTSDAAACNYM